ncbi:predicted protein [Streptomyces sp. AA4]|nr:predicted protein [Streptomyces sp. AA4]
MRAGPDQLVVDFATTSAGSPCTDTRPRTTPPSRTKGSDRDNGSEREDMRNVRRGWPMKDQRNGRHTAPARRSRRTARNDAPAIPTPEQRAQQQLANAPQRSRRWAEDLARFYGLGLPD